MFIRSGRSSQPSAVRSMQSSTEAAPDSSCQSASVFRTVQRPGEGRPLLLQDHRCGHHHHGRNGRRCTWIPSRLPMCRPYPRSGLARLQSHLDHPVRSSPRVLWRSGRRLWWNLLRQAATTRMPCPISPSGTTCPTGKGREEQSPLEAYLRAHRRRLGREQLVRGRYRGRNRGHELRPK